MGYDKPYITHAAHATPEAHAAEFEAARQRIMPTFEPPELPGFRHEVSGILPGYAGHIPRAKDLPGESAHGAVQTHPEYPIGMPGEARDITQRSVGFRQGHPDVVPDPKKNHWAEMPAYKQFTGGLVPGYTGFKPHAKDSAGASDYGALRMQPAVHTSGLERSRTPPPGGWEQQGRTWQMTKAEAADQYTFREETNGIIPGYMGHRRKAKDFMGASAYGRLPTAQQLPTPGESPSIVPRRAQTTHRARRPDFSTGACRTALRSGDTSEDITTAPTADAARSPARPARAPSPGAGRAASPRKGEASPRARSPRPSSPRGGGSPRKARPASPRSGGAPTSSPTPHRTPSKTADGRNILVMGDKPHRIDRRAVIPGATYHVPGRRDEIGITAFGVGGNIFERTA